MSSSHQNVQDDLTKNSFTHPASTEPYFQYALAMVLQLALQKYQPNILNEPKRDLTVLSCLGQLATSERG